jgi:hypothetical protein
MNGRHFWCGLLLLVLCGCGQSSPRHFTGAPFPAMTTLTCDLKSRHFGDLNPDYARERSSDRMTLTFTNFSVEAHTAQLIGNKGTARVEFRRADDQLQFLETTPSGNLIVTSVFAPPSQGSALPAVHSRHILMAPGSIVISQYAGSCTPKS